MDGPKIFRQAFRFSDKQSYRGAMRPPMPPLALALPNQLLARCIINNKIENNKGKYIIKVLMNL